MKRALVLSGGGANGAFQYGALKYIEEVVKPQFPNFEYQIISGVSVGSLNGVLLAMGKFEQLGELWGAVDLQKLIYRGTLSWFPILRRLLSRDKSLLDNGPLFKLLQKHVRLSEIQDDQYDLRIGLVSLRDGKFRSLRPADFEKDLEFQKAILASTAIPVLWKPVAKIETKHGILEDVVDGSIRDTSPLGDVIADNPDEVIIINCRSPYLPLPKDETSGNNLLSIAKRALVDIAIDEIFLTDLREFLTINDLLRQVEEGAPDLVLYNNHNPRKKHIPLRRFRTVLIEPNEDLGSLLDFTPERIQYCILQGYDTAAKVFENYQDDQVNRFYCA